MEGATVDDFVAGSVAALTRPFVCDHATLQALAAPEHAAVLRGVADVNRKLVKDWSSFYAVSRRRLLLKGLQQLSDGLALPAAQSDSGAGQDESSAMELAAADDGAEEMERRAESRKRTRVEEDDLLHESSETQNPRIQLIGRCVELRERLALTRERRERVCSLARAADGLRAKMRQMSRRTDSSDGTKRDLDAAGGEEGERLGGAQMLRKALAEEIGEASGLVAQMGARMHA